MKAIKKVIDKTRPPVFAAKLFTLAFSICILRENETAATGFRTLVAHVRAAAVGSRQYQSEKTRTHSLTKAQHQSVKAARAPVCAMLMSQPTD